MPETSAVCSSPDYPQEIVDLAERTLGKSFSQFTLRTIIALGFSKLRLRRGCDIETVWEELQQLLPTISDLSQREAVSRVTVRLLQEQELAFGSIGAALPWAAIVLLKRDDPSMKDNPEGATTVLLQAGVDLFAVDVCDFESLNRLLWIVDPKHSIGLMQRANWDAGIGLTLHQKREDKSITAERLCEVVVESVSEFDKSDPFVKNALTRFGREEVYKQERGSRGIPVALMPYVALVLKFEDPRTAQTTLANEKECAFLAMLYQASDRINDLEVQNEADVENWRHQKGLSI